MIVGLDAVVGWCSALSRGPLPLESCWLLVASCWLLGGFMLSSLGFAGPRCPHPNPSPRGEGPCVILTDWWASMPTARETLARHLVDLLFSSCAQPAETVGDFHTVLLVSGLCRCVFSVFPEINNV
jgi:hypothetical protein